MEYWTVLNNFGELSAADGSITFSFDGNVSIISPGDDYDDYYNDNDGDDDAGPSHSVSMWTALYYGLFFGLPACMAACTIWICCRHRKNMCCCRHDRHATPDLTHKHTTLVDIGSDDTSCVCNGDTTSSPVHIEAITRENRVGERRAVDNLGARDVRYDSVEMAMERIYTDQDD